MSPRAKEDRYELAQFINAHFLPSGSELVPVDPPDFTETPSLLGALRNDSNIHPRGRTC